MPEHSKTKTLIAFDFMRLSWSQLEWAWRYTDLYASLIQNQNTLEEEIRVYPEERYF